MTDKELYEYKKIYGKYIKDALIEDKDYLMELSGDELKSEMDKLKTRATKDTKYDMNLGY